MTSVIATTSKPETTMFADIEWVETTSDTADALRSLIAEAHRFFAQSADEKAPLRAEKKTTGWREIGVEYSQSPDRPDLNETFCFRAHDDRGGSLPNAPIIEACRTAQAALDVVATATLNHLARSMGVAVGEKPVVRTNFESWVQINFSRPAAASREWIQEAHEDGHLVTFLFSDADGLEVQPPSGEWTPVLPSPEKLVCFPGECGAFLTGDAIIPMPHRVRAHKNVPLRVSVAYFVNPDLDQELPPWFDNDRNRGVDLLHWGQQNPTRFGLPAL
jgi:isopenicillin N synthase-like dioxygenase